MIDSAIRERLSAPFLAAGVTSDRLAFVGGLELQDHLDFHNEVDLLLDTMPFNGFTTTFEALSMGVPSLTIEGNCFVDRTTHSLLHHAGLERFSRVNRDDYTSEAIRLAKRPNELSPIRSYPRERLIGYPLTQVTTWVPRLEAADLDFLSLKVSVRHTLRDLT